MKKIKILDTNVFLTDPKALFHYPEELLVIPISVIDELDDFKKGQTELSRNARFVLKKIDKLRKRGRISDNTKDANAHGIELNNKGRLIIELNHMDQIPKGLSEEKVDNRILAVASHYTKKYPDSEVSLITMDANLRIKADAFGILALDYESPMTQAPDTLYKGYKEQTIDTTVLKELRKKKIVETEFVGNPNEFLILRTDTGEEEVAQLKKIGSKNVLKTLDNISAVYGVSALNAEQVLALSLLLDPEIPLVTITGKAGTGKTLLAVASALKQVLEEQDPLYEKILISRPVVPLGKDIGFLPGPQPLTAKILTPKGWTTMGELKVGDYVIARNGTKTKVIGIFPKGKKSIYKIETTEGSTHSCLDHLWKTQTWEEKKRGKEGKVRTTKEIKETLLNKKGKFNHYLPRNEAVHFEQKRSLPIPPYVFGALIGDGSFSNHICLTSKDEEIIQRSEKELKTMGCELNHVGSLIYNISSKLYNNKPANKVSIIDPNGNQKIYNSIGIALKELDINRSTLHHRCRHNSKIDGYSYSFIEKENRWQNKIKEEIQKMNLLGKRSWEKSIPEVYMYADIQSRLDLLRGLMDTDGNCKKNGEASFTTTSPILAKQMVELVRSLGGRSYITSRIRKKNKKSLIRGRLIHSKRRVYEVGVSLPEQYNPFFLTRKAERYSKAYMHYEAIKKISYVGKQECQCILVEDPEHLYITDDYIVTHNTMEEKLDPWMQPIYDNLEYVFNQGKSRQRSRQTWRELIEQSILKVEALSYIRGRSIPQQFMIIDEAQNLTLHEVKTIITRAGKGTKLVFTGDPEQIDNPYVDSQSNGLTQIIERLKDDELTGHVNLEKGERSPLAEMASKKLI